MMTTTITTVGYGDFKGYYDDSGDWATEMAFLIFVTIMGIILFSQVTNEVFKYEHFKSADEVAKIETSKIENYLNDVSRVMKEIWIE